MAIINEKECRHAAIDSKVVRRIAAGIERYAKEAQRLHITVFGGSTSGSLRFADTRDKTPLILAFMGGSWDGGDGGEMAYDEDSLMRGE